MKYYFGKFGRPNVPWTAIVVTDGISKNETATAIEAKGAELMGINMIAVGIGHRIDISELNAIASTPQQVKLINDFSKLQPLLASMMTKICRK